jgi:serine/threonine-protein kinase
VVETTSVSDGFGEETADMPDVGNKLGGRWRTVRRLGTGGMGAVYEAVSDDGQRVAVKLLDDAASRERFLREASAAKAIDSEHVVKTFELGVDEALGRPFLVMELCEGDDLASVLARAAPLAPEVVARIGVGAARGLAAAHAASVVHRDVKPSNVFLHRDGDGYVVKVCDFGIAKTMGETDVERASLELTRTGGFLGSPRYMSPEQAKSAKNVDHRSDVWSLCVTLYESLTGRELWAGRSTLGEVIVAICTEPIEPLSKAAPWVQAGLARAVERGLERDPDRRWQSMDALAEELERCAGGRGRIGPEDLGRFDPPASARVGSRRRELVIAGGVGLLVIAGALAILTRPDPAAPIAAPEVTEEHREAAEPAVLATAADPKPTTADAGAAVAAPSAHPAREPRVRTSLPSLPASARPAETAAPVAEPRPAPPASSPMLTPKEDW